MRTCRALAFATVLLPITALACAAPDAGSDQTGTEEEALTSLQTLRKGAVTLLASHRYRALYAVENAGGRELCAATLSGGERKLATFAPGDDISLLESTDEGVLLLRHGPYNGASALAIVDLRPAVPTYVDAVPAGVAQRAFLRGGTILYTHTTPNGESNLFVRTSDGTTKQAPGTAWGDRYRMSADGKRIAYWSSGVLTAFDTKSGATVTAGTDPGLTFDFVGSALLYSNPRRGELSRLDAAGPRRFYDAPVAASDFEWFARPDGQILAATHTSGQAEWTQMELVDAQTGEGTYFPSAARAAVPHYESFRHVSSKDGRWLIDWYKTRDAVGEVWLHDLAASPSVASTKLASGVTVGWMRNGKYFVGMGNTLAARCGFEGAFVRCTTSDADAIGTLFPLANPSKAFPRPYGSSSHDGTSACFVTAGVVACATSDGTVVQTPATRARPVRAGDAWFNGRFAFEERDVATGLQRLSLVDPKTGSREAVTDRSCREGAYTISTTPQRLFVADCTGLHVAR